MFAFNCGVVEGDGGSGNGGNEHSVCVTLFDKKVFYSFLQKRMTSAEVKKTESFSSQQ